MGREAIGQRIATVEAHRMSAISTNTMTRFFSEEFRTQNAATVSRHQRLLESTDPEGYTACAAALCEANTTARLGQIRVPTLVIASSHDISTPVETAYALTKSITGAQMVTLQGCAHLSAVEQPQAFANVLGEFVAGI